MQYASKVKISYLPLKVAYTRTVQLPNRLLHAEDITECLNGEERFELVHNEAQGLETESFSLEIHGYRYETEEEMKRRIALQEKYNKGYEEFWAIH